MEFLPHMLAILALCSAVRGHIYRSEMDANTTTTTHNDVFDKWEDLTLEQKRISSSSAEKKVLDGEHPDLLLQQMDAIPMFEQGEMSAVITMLQTMSNEMESLRNALSNVKYQNHIIYKQLKRMNNKCSANPGENDNRIHDRLQCIPRNKSSLSIERAFVSWNTLYILPTVFLCDENNCLDMIHSLEKW